MAIEAARALLDQVFLDGLAGGAFDYDASSTNGCSTSTLCAVYTPYALDRGMGNGTYTANYAPDSGGGLETVGNVPISSGEAHTADGILEVYAV